MTTTHTINLGSHSQIIIHKNSVDGLTWLESNLKDDCNEPPDTCVGCAAIDGIEALILAQTNNGIDVTTQQYKESNA